MFSHLAYIVFINSIFKMKKTIFLLIGLILFACKKDQTDSLRNKDLITIDFESSLVDKLKFSQFVDTIEFIPLETTDESLISDVNRIVYADSLYYIHSTRSLMDSKLLVFNSSGQFCRKISQRGYGPGEYIDITDFLVTDEYVVIATNFKLIKYDKQGRFFKEYKIEQQVKEFLERKDSSYLVYNFGSDRKGFTLLNQMNDEGVVEARFFKRKENEVKISSNRINLRSLIFYDNSYYLNYPYRDTIFEIQNENVRPFYYVNYGNKQIPEELFDLSDEHDVMIKKLSSLDDYICLTSFGLAEHYLYIGSHNKYYQAYITLYSKNTGKTISARKLEDDMFFKGNIFPLTFRLLPHNSDNGDILWEVEPSYLIEGYRKYMSNLSEPRRAEFKSKYPDLVKMCTTLKEDDNPVLLRIKVKEF